MNELAIFNGTVTYPSYCPMLRDTVTFPPQLLGQAFGLTIKILTALDETFAGELIKETFKKISDYSTLAFPFFLSGGAALLYRFSLKAISSIPTLSLSLLKAVATSKITWLTITYLGITSVYDCLCKDYEKTIDPYKNPLSFLDNFVKGDEPVEYTKWALNRQISKVVEKHLVYSQILNNLRSINTKINGRLPYDEEKSILSELLLNTDNSIFNENVSKTHIEEALFQSILSEKNFKIKIQSLIEAVQIEMEKALEEMDIIIKRLNEIQTTQNEQAFLKRKLKDLTN